MPARVYSSALIGLNACLIEVEADVLRAGLHAFTLVGLPDAAIRESRERVSVALKNCGFKPPHHCGRITVNLGPADLPKNSPAYDLPIALSFLVATEQLSFPAKGKLFVGELSLDGSVRSVQGVLSHALFARDAGIKELFVPFENASEAALVKGITVFGVTSLVALYKHLRGEESLKSVAHQDALVPAADDQIDDFSHVRGQSHAKRALEIAAAGGHNLIFVGPPGSGKTLLAKTFPTILPELSFDERLEVTKVFSAAGKLARGRALVTTRPFRAPHHSASAVALIGGGSHPRPGEISLAHRGVLFLDEFGEFPRFVLENLREPLEAGAITVARAGGTITFPARFMLVAAMNPCPCGYYGDPEKACACSPGQVLRYRQKVSGPLLDRIDLHVSLPRVSPEELVSKETESGERSSAIRERVNKARFRQQERFQRHLIGTNAEMDARLIREVCRLDADIEQFLLDAARRMALSARGYSRILKVARTIADLDGSEFITLPHVSEALQYRFRDD